MRATLHAVALLALLIAVVCLLTPFRADVERAARLVAPEPAHDASLVRHVNASLVRHVNVFAGTAPAHSSFSRGNTLPLIARPWGFNAWAPLTTSLPASNAWWFLPSTADPGFAAAPSLFGVRCTHQPSPWIGDYGSFALVPVLGEGNGLTAGDGDVLLWEGTRAEVQPHAARARLNGPRPGSGALDFALAPTSHGAIATLALAASDAPAGRAALRIVGRTDADAPVRVHLARRAAGRFELVIFPLAQRCAAAQPCAEGQRLHVSVELDPPPARALAVGSAPRATGGYAPVRAAPLALTPLDRAAAHVEADGLVDGLLDGELLLELASPARQPTTVRIGTSFISGALAREASRRELGARSLDEVALEGLREWEGVLRKAVVVDVAGDGDGAAAPRTGDGDGDGGGGREGDGDGDGRREGDGGADGTRTRLSPEAALLCVWYTQAYRAALFPRFLDELDLGGARVHWSPYTGERGVSGRLVADSGFWDAHRTVYPWLGLVAPAVHGEMLQGWLSAARENGGFVPQWASPGARTCGSLHKITMSDITLADALVKRAAGFNETAAMAALLRSVTDAAGASEVQGRRELLALMLEYGYLPHDGGGTAAKPRELPESVSLSLNSYYADFAVAQAARALCARGVARELSCTGGGRFASLAEELERRASNFPALFARATDRARPADDASSAPAPLGSFQRRGRAGARAAQPMEEWGFGFTEAGAHQYRFYVPFNASGLGALFGGRLCEAMEAGLTAPFAGSSEGGYGSEIHELVEARAVGARGFGQLAHSNQPSHYWLHLMRAGSRDETPACAARARAWIRRALRELYSASGYAGDEDNGEMAAWFLLSAAGLYPLVLATDQLVLGAPLFARVDLAVHGGRTLSVRRRRRARAGDEADVDALWESADAPAGAPAERLRVHASHAAVVRGGTLTFLEDDDFDPRGGGAPRARET